MIKVKIAAIGKLKEDYLKSAVTEYAKRINKYAKLSIIEGAESKNTLRSDKAIECAKKDEGEQLMAISSGYLVALDSRGEMLSSEEFASLIKAQIDKGEEITFAVGGSDGLGNNILTKADKMISFGRVTYPHQLMRVILLEQIYRALNIINNTAYHK